MFVYYNFIPRHFDYCNVWLEDSRFAEDTFIIITNTMESQVRYLVVQSLLSHVDTKSGTEKQLKGVILNVLSRCVGVAADESIGRVWSIIILILLMVYLSQ